jgi:hypothetical protein
MAKDKRRKELDEIFKDIDQNEKNLIDNLLDEVAYLEERLTELKKLPFISVNPKNPAMQKTTAAAKQYKECSQSYMNAIRILVGILRKVETTAQDDLLRRLEEFQV